MDIDLTRRFFFSGIGGVSMSGLAHALCDLGAEVAGSDITESETLASLRSAGIKTFVPKVAENLAGYDVVVRTTAVTDDNPEMQEARRLGLLVLHRSQVLAWLCHQRRGLAITGTHGKSTTTGMTAAIFRALEQDPAVFVGGELPCIQGNYHLGRGEWIIFEACESDGTFINYTNCCQVLTSVEADHLDQHGTFENVKKSFRAFAELVDPDGFLVYNADSPEVCETVDGIATRLISYGLQADADLQAKNIITTPTGVNFNLFVEHKFITHVKLPVWGAHNIADALAALGCAWGASLELTAAARALAGFRAVGRRFEEIANVNNIRIVDDYAHHPTEVRATLAAAREAHAGRIVAIFQPHLRSRTSDLLTEFGQAFNGADVLVLTDIYQAREDGTVEFDITRLMDEVRKNAPQLPIKLIRSLKDIPAELAPSLLPGDLVLAIGAGDINRVAPALATYLRGM